MNSDEKRGDVPIPGTHDPKDKDIRKSQYKKLKQLFQDNNQLIKTLAFGLLLLFKSFFICAQNKSEIKDKIHLQNIILAKDKIDKGDRTSDNPYFHIAFDYDYGDSISLFVKGKNIYNVRLNYVPDTSTSFYPYNRMLLKLSNKQISKHSKCEIVFRISRRRAAFRLNRKFEYYSLEVLKNASTWKLTYSNTYPWPN